jgi:hypothetical protein
MTNFLGLSVLLGKFCFPRLQLELSLTLLLPISGKRDTGFSHVGELPPARRWKLDKFS